MIQAKPHDLRLGNWIYDDEGKLSKIETLQTPEFNEWNGSDGLFQIKRDDGQFYCDIVFGVELTEEWLKRFGFKATPHFTITNSYTFDIGRNRVINVGDVSNPNLMIWLCEVDGQKTTDLVCLHNWDYDGPMYVHKLQNLHYALTGQELNINE